MNYQEYASQKIKLFEKLRDFEVLTDNIKGPFNVNNDLLHNFNGEFLKYINKRNEDHKFKQSDIDEFKNNFLNSNKAFSTIRDYRGAAVYWFEIKSHHTQKDISDMIDAVKIVRQEGRWISQAKNAHRSLSTNHLYVGKVKTQNTFFTRVISHLGLWNKRTSSLQLLYWMPKFPMLELDFYYYEIHDEYVALIDDIENVLWHQKRPLLGSI